MKIHNDEKLIMIAIMVCALAGLFGFSFAYFTVGAPVPTGSAGDGISATTIDNLNNTTFNAGTKLNLENAYPGAKDSKTFSVNLGTETASYTIKLNITRNTFEKCTNENYAADSNECELDANEITYTLKRGSQVIKENVDITTATGAITLATENQTGKVNYTLEVEYHETNKDQNHNMNKILEAELDVEF